MGNSEWEGGGRGGKGAGFYLKTAAKQYTGEERCAHAATMQTSHLRRQVVQEDRQPTLDVIYENWRGFDEKLRRAVAPLTDEQLLLRPAAHMWPLGWLVQHIISVRAGWFSGTLQDEDEQMEAYMWWGQRESPARSAAELVRGLEETWSFMETRLRRWTAADRAETFPDEWEGEIYEVSRSWVIYHVLEHDLFHGGEVSLILGMNGLQGLEL